MIVELREYTLQVGKVPEYLRLLEEEGFPIQKPILGRMVGYFQTEIGPLNQVVQLWAYDNLADREERRARLVADPGWQSYLAKIRPMIVTQASRILKPASVMERGG